VNDSAVNEILARLAVCDVEQRRAVFLSLRKEFPIHELEATFGVSAEVMLEAISRASDLTQRGILGVIAEAEFGSSVAASLSGWNTTVLTGDYLYDYQLSDNIGSVRVQVKRQRREKGVPKLDNGLFVVETQKTRTGADMLGGKTRPYRFGDFDILAVCMHASSSNWSDFMYTVARWLIPKLDDRACLQTMQYIPKAPNDDWTSNFLTAVDWLRSPINKTVAGRTTKSARKIVTLEVAANDETLFNLGDQGNATE